ncbi:hypothetical protein DENSPDRAFT_346289 [Dentipellis sp. KUC8613]|nr:hypothetical protein DENSPDRAFT_346289 [Dentipellis sp. KUC8613]
MPLVKRQAARTQRPIENLAQTLLWPREPGHAHHCQKSWWKGHERLEQVVRVTLAWRGQWERQLEDRQSDRLSRGSSAEREARDDVFSGSEVRFPGSDFAVKTSRCPDDIPRNDMRCLTKWPHYLFLVKVYHAVQDDGGHIAFRRPPKPSQHFENN